ncbi:MAG: hypothetical protein ACOY3P_11610 [Planctomycetota bacterium]
MKRVPAILIVLYLFAIPPYLPSACAAEEPVTWFSTGGETIYHLRGAQTGAGPNRSIVSAAYSGKVLCFDYAGKKLWEQSAGEYFPFDLDAGDIDGDGFDECAVASSDGSLYLIDHDGRLLAKVFENKPPLYSVKIVRWGNNAGIICGGTERVLYHVSPQGKVVASFETRSFDTPWPGVVKSIEVGQFSQNGEESLAIGMQMDWNRSIFSLHRLPGLEPIGEARNDRQRPRGGLGIDHYHLAVLDANGDGIDEIAFGEALGGAVCNADGKRLYSLQERRTGRGQHIYSMVMPAVVPSDDGHGDQLIGMFASHLRFYGSDGRIRKEVPLAISPAGLCYDAPSKTLLLGSAQSGGDCVYCVRLDRPGWEESLRSLGYQGKIRQIVGNVETLIKQIDEFQPPPYQPRENPDFLCVFNYTPGMPGAVKDLAPERSLIPLMRFYRSEFPYPHLQFAGNQWLSERRDRSKMPYGWDQTRDRRLPYQLTSDEVVDQARRLEREGLPFVWTIGHGNDPFFLSLSTIEGILRAAPTACKGFIFPEVARDETPAFQYAVHSHVKPVCDLCLKYGNRKVFLRSKFLFWVADSRIDTWSWMIEDKKYRDVIVPAMEETYERLGDLSMSGRVGLQQGGWVADWAGRAVQDNPCYDREHQWAATMVGSHFLRALCYRAGLGAKYFLIQLGETTTGSETPSFRDHGPLVVKPFLHMLGKGILLCPQTSAAALSRSSIALGMRKSSDAFMQASHNSHQITQYESDPKWVFSRLQCFWGQAPTPKYDFGYYGVGRRRQAMNFLPTHPYGFVPIVPADHAADEVPGIERLLETDGEYWYDEQGNRRTAEEYAEEVEKILRSANERMFARVRGDVAWTATRIDDRHVRLVLIDSGYLDPADRIAEVAIHVDVVSATDIFSRENIDVRNNAITVKVPMGVLRVIDIEHR